MLEQIEAGQLIQDLKMNVLQAIKYIIQAWIEVTPNTIRNCWNHVGILPDINFKDDDDVIHENDNLIISDKLDKVIKTLYLPDMMNMKEYLNLPEEDIVNEISDDCNISEIASLFKNEANINHPDEIDDSVETEIISDDEALKGSKTIYTFLLQKDNASEYIKLINKIEKFIKREKVNSMQQSTIDQYFGSE
jgi:hypothetical protein